MILFSALMGCIFISAEEARERYDVDGDGVEVFSDCDDRDASIALPVEWYPDGDGDGWGDGASVEACVAPEGYAAAGDCDDDDASIHPGAEEACDGLDQDCDSDVDEGTPGGATAWYPDEDADGYGSEADVVYACEELTDYLTEGGDCDDTEASVNPAADELCDGIDNDCDGRTDDEDDDVADATSWAPDADGDGYGDGETASTLACEAPDGYTAAGDCDDNDADINPDAEEICDDGVDNNCDGAACRYDGSLDVDYARATINGQMSNSMIGSLIVGGQDVNEDGYTDVLLGAPGEGYLGGGGAGMDGRAYLFAGPVEGRLSASSATALATFEAGSLSGAQLGYGGALSDLDGDGVLDVVVTGDRVSYDGNFEVGAAFIFSGPVEGVYEADDAVAIYGDMVGGMAARTAAATDFDGDGIDDLLVSAPSQRVSGQDLGAIYLFQGPVTATASMTSADVTLTGEDAFDMPGFSMEAGRDITGDGYPDALVGAPYFDDSRGKVYVVEGPIDESRALNYAGSALTGESFLANAGDALGFAGDVDGDGHEDVLIGAESYSSEPSASAYEGAAYLVFGPINENIELSDADLILKGEYYDFVGGGLDGVGDIDGDGQDDFVIGASGDAQYKGVAWLYYDTPTGSHGVSDLAQASITGDVEWDYFGDVVEGAGDMDGDGIDDFWVAAPVATSGVAGIEGSVYLFSGGIDL